MKLKTQMLTAVACLCIASAAGPSASSQNTNNHAAMPEHSGMHEHMSAGAAVTMAELESTVTQLTLARHATEKYLDARVAVAEGYEAIGPYVPGMGYHYVNTKSSSDFDIEHPPILVYEKDTTAAQGLRLVGVSYLLNAPTGANGQPTTSPFPPALASWHKHSNICRFPDRSVATNLDASQCEQRGGAFTAETQWMIHAWIWKDSPAGVFSPMNPSVK